MAIFALLVEEGKPMYLGVWIHPETDNLEKVRIAILHNKLLPGVSDLLSRDKISTKMLDRLLWSLGKFMQYGPCSVHYAIASLISSVIDDLRGSILQTGAVYTLALLRLSKRLPDDSKALLSKIIADGQDIASIHAFM
jgi:hypothetical protein